ncbi:MAG TPA: DNA (cytosine-5-)-methyltransferase [Paraburkholderia sp.]|uniref:DNA cytosine methyltransferase n=1 Tax=Paraburkholderia sp. TaxID=1926495 RepID=UPI002B49768D|nr:DNA (cytosine-5-)-methyltransferase [Paraburkholderia sp.]HKR45485.1 DNA (cytosine-5-)-methyltransferase [Paraburkholderia sp.]
MAEINLARLADEQRRKSVRRSHKENAGSTCIELFAGCGGMATGLQLAGFKHTALVEFNPSACETLRRNFGRVQLENSVAILEQDVRDINWRERKGIDVVAGGPPCQPFSMGGLAAGAYDSRNMWPEAIRAVQELRPRAFLFENVKGLLRPAFGEYLEEIARALRCGGEGNDGGSYQYDVTVVLVNAADYGAPQRRERVFVAGVRIDCGTMRPFPRPTHSLRRLVWDKWVTGEYWRKHNVAPPGSGPVTGIEQKALREIQRARVEPQELPWQTCRDGFEGLGEPSTSPSDFGHEFRPGAKAYPGHEGSPIDLPAKALKAGAHGVPGGENMLVENSGSARYFTVREAARLQGMPDGFEILGSASQAMRQLGNAVPVQLAEVAARWIRECLSDHDG